ncbi:MAG TPA: TonB-dependent receptor [Parafilimonas sp.]|nr:TonB-dependent receptor [Parafilimonas sp.]
MSNRLHFKRFVLLFSLLLTIKSAWATSDENDEGLGGVRGKISTSDNRPAAMVSVILKNTRKNNLTADDGSFIIRNVQPGNYILEVSLIGYEPLSENVTIQADKTIEVSLQLQVSDKQLQDVIVKTGGGYKINTPSSSLRITTPILELPQNIQEITGKTLKDQQVISMSDGVVRNVSGTVRLEHWADMYTNISARGSQVQAFRNGFNVVNSYWGPLTEDMSFVDHIEFVKGPAGFMLSGGDPSGLYNVVTKKPTGVTKGAAEITVGSYDLYRATLDLDGKLSSDGKLLYRLNLMGQNKGSFRPDEFNNRYSIAPVISYQVDDKTKLTLEYTLQHAKMSDVGSYYVYGTDGYATLPRDFTTLPPGLEPTTMDDHSVFLNMQHQFNKDWKLTVQGAYFHYKQTGTSMWPAAVNTDGTMLRSVSSWDALSNMTLAQAFVNGEAYTGTVRHRILGGIDIGTKNYWADWGQYFQLDSVGGEFNTLDPGNRMPPNGYPSFDHDMSTLKQRATAIGGLQGQRYTSAYIQDELGFFNDVLRVTLAARYTDLAMTAWGTDNNKAKHFTPRAGVSVSIDQHTSLYGLYDQAFMPQAAGGRITGGGKLQPITGNNIEFGVKRDWMNGKWNTSLSVYRIIKNNEATADPDSPDPNNPEYIIIGQKRAQGIEFDLRGQIAPGLNLVANYAYTDSRVTKANEGGGLKADDIVPGYATHTANAWLNYQVQGGALKGVGASAGFTFLGDRHTEWEESAIKLPDYFKLDGGLFWQGEKLRVTANVFNLLNKYLYSGSYYSWLSAYYWQAEPGRNLRFSISYNF